MEGSLEQALAKHLDESLGLRPKLGPWLGQGSAPYHLADAFTWRQAVLVGQPVLFALASGEDAPSLAAAKAKLKQAMTCFDGLAVLVVPALTSYQRRYLIQSKVPFVVPGNQLYLPDLGLDLREHFRRAAPPSGAPLSPAAQATLLLLLLHAKEARAWMTPELVQALGFTPMTLSRVTKELVSAQLVEVHKVGRGQALAPKGDAPEVWKKAQAQSRSPIRRRAWISPNDATERLSQACVSGTSALEGYTSLSAMGQRTLALGPSEWAALMATHPKLQAEGEGDSVLLEVWRHPVRLLNADATIVDPLSLALCWRQEGDERIQLALQELEEHFPW